MNVTPGIGAVASPTHSPDDCIAYENECRDAHAPAAPRVLGTEGRALDAAHLLEMAPEKSTEVPRRQSPRSSA